MQKIVIITKEQVEISAMGEGPCEELKKTLEQASVYLDKGQYLDAFLLLEKLEHIFSGSKDVSELLAVAEVCFAATKTSCSCTKPQQSKSLDWYLILKVEENTEIDVIRRRYRQLALLLHPDKNKHPKAEAAFKLVSEAYACLSDKRKRVVFNAERSKLLCKRCAQKTQKSTGHFTSSASGEVKFGQKHSKTSRLFVERDGTNPERKSDEEKLQMFRERARARVDSTAQAWKDRRARFREEFQAVNNTFQCSRVDRKNLPTFEASESQFPNYPHRRVPVEKAASSDVPIFKDSEDRFLWYTQARNFPTSETRSRCRGEKLETPIYEQPIGKKVPFSELKRNVLGKDLKEILKERQAFYREPTKAPRNLDGLLRKLQAESGRDAQYYGAFRDSDIWRRNRMEDNKNSINTKNQCYNQGSETSDTDGEAEESLDWHDPLLKNRCLQHFGEDQYSNVLRNKLSDESKFSPTRKNAYCYSEVRNRTCKGVENVVCGENVKKSEELLKTLEHLREEAKDVAATLEKLRKSVGSEEDHVVRNLFCQKCPVPAGS
eukprot:Gb_02877 [translate_table: standard]